MKTPNIFHRKPRHLKDERKGPAHAADADAAPLLAPDSG